MISEVLKKSITNSIVICLFSGLLVHATVYGGEEKSAPEPVVVEAKKDQPNPHSVPDTGFRYLIAPGDSINIFVWGNPDVSGSVPVRPDGIISAPLIEDLFVAGRSASDVARDIAKRLETYIKSPNVTVTVSVFKGLHTQQIRILGEASKPQAIPYNVGMTILDVMIAVGGLTTYADGNNAKIFRRQDGVAKEIRVRLDDLIKSGDIKANLVVEPGDILIIPESWF